MTPTPSTPTVNDLLLAKKQAAYDAAAKRFLSTRIILAWILKYCVEEFKGYDMGKFCKTGKIMMYNEPLWCILVVTKENWATSC